MISLPDIEYLQTLSRSVLSDFDASSVKSKLGEIVRYYDMINFSLDYEWPIWRARICFSPQGHRNVGDLSYPPIKLTGPGRMNNPMEPILYASLSKFSAFAEVGVQEDDHVHLIGYRIRSGEKIRCGVVGEIFNVWQSQDF